MDFILSFLVQSLIRVALLVQLVFFFLLLLFFSRWSIFITVDFVKFLKSILCDYAGLIFIINRLCFHWLACRTNRVIIILSFFHKLGCILFIEVIEALKDPSFHHIWALRAGLRVRRGLAGCESWTGIVVKSLRNHSWEDWGWIFETVIPRHMPYTLGVNDRFLGLLTWVKLNLPSRWVFQLLIKSIFERSLWFSGLLTRWSNWDPRFCLLSQLIILDIASMSEIFFRNKDLYIRIHRVRRLFILTFKFIRKMAVEHSSVSATLRVTRGLRPLKLAFRDITSSHWNSIQRNVMWIILVRFVLTNLRLLQWEWALEVVGSESSGR